MIVPFRKDPLLPGLLSMASLFPRTTSTTDHRIPKESKPSTRDTKKFKKAKSKRKMAAASRRKNW